MNKAIRAIESFLWAYLYANPILDIITGIYSYMLFTDYVTQHSASGLTVTPSLVIRMAVLLVFAVYILLIRDKKSIICALPLGAALLLSLVSEYIAFGALGLGEDVKYFARFCYNVAVLMVYSNLFRRMSLSREDVLDKIEKMFTVILYLFEAGIVIPFIIGEGYYTYADRFGFRGFRGMYYSGNDVTAAFMLLLPPALCRFLSPEKTERRLGSILFYGLSPTLAILCLEIIGTKTAFLAVIICVGLLLIYSLWLLLREKKWEPLVRLALVAVSSFALMGLLSVISGKSIWNSMIECLFGFEYAANESTQTLILSGRQYQLGDTFAAWRAAGPLGWLFGIGRGSREFVIEMDIFEVLFYYGVFGFLAMLWMYVALGVSFVIKFFRSIQWRTLGAFISLASCAGYLVIAGHVLFSVTSGFYFAFTLVYAALMFPDREPGLKSKKV